MRERFLRSEALLGREAMRLLEAARVLVVGVGGVGSWCAEALVRTGVGKIALVDDDTVAPSNVNRQCPATTETIGRPKVEAMAERLKAINPACEVVASVSVFSRGSRGARDSGCPGESGDSSDTWNGDLADYDLVVDAIDSVDCKAELILWATEAGIPLVSSMGAALRTDPTKVRISRFEKVEGDGLARALRQRFRKLGRWPKGRFGCVWSGEAPVECCPRSILCTSGQETASPFRAGKGSLMQVTAVFGMCLASEAIKILTKGEAK